ncbi:MULTISPECIES: type II toxin-antitoxin system VapC family toxin [Asaia]|uniref:Ribonuclease VapC n=1 Tax=Asaia spathodeae TaxID=657016 RepID=A0ABX2PAA4_9PROT|nr:type II toxin-antitoxin system VapC family toxin [Asaia spathodeae]GBR20171.1 PilT protein-like protein [Asaia spathodeae NBRC 105894]
MLVLDTNILSAVMKAQPDPVVTRWLDRQGNAALRTTSVNVFEVRFGLARMEAGRRRTALNDAFSAMLVEDLGGAGLELDDRAADVAATLAAEREAVGRPVDFRDTTIAAIAVRYDATLVTRNLRHFFGLPIPVISPWGTE